jgi:predicted transcriptional regulator
VLVLSDNSNLIELTAGIAAAYASNNKIAADDLPALIKTIFAAMAGGEPAAEAEPVKVLTKAQIRKSVTREALISFEDGRPYRALKRHLASRNLTPDEYRAKWGLPKDYAMVAISYSEERSRLAKALGLGRKAAQAAPEPATAPPRAKKASTPRKPLAPKAAAPTAPEQLPDAIDPQAETFT